MERNPVLRVLRRFLCPSPAVQASMPAPEGVRVASAKDVVEGKPLCADVGGKEIAIFKTKTGYAAIDNVCPHIGGPLCKGKVEDGQVECPWHGSKFDIATGAAAKGPAKAGVAAYPVERRGDDLFVRGIPMPRPAPKAAVFGYGTAFDKNRPFDHAPFLDELLAALKFPFKLYGVLPLVVIGQSPDEIDAHLGPVHVTEADLKKLSEVMDAANKKWGTAVTYCFFHTSQFLGDMLLNIRGPKAPDAKENDVKY